MAININKVEMLIIYVVIGMQVSHIGFKIYLYGKESYCYLYDIDAYVNGMSQIDRRISLICDRCHNDTAILRQYLKGN